MGCFCSKSSDNAVDTLEEEGGTTVALFRRLDKEGKGYISRQNLQDLMKDDKTHFQGNDVDHIMEKFGQDGKIYLENFKAWWNSTYTTYNDDDEIAKMVREVKQEHDCMDAIEELPEVHGSDAPHNSNVAVSRS